MAKKGGNKKAPTPKPPNGVIKRLIDDRASSDVPDQIISANMSNLPDQPQIRDRSDVADDIFNRSFSLMSPAIDKSNERLLTNLQARGIPVGAEAFNDAYGNQQTRTQEAIARLAMDANIGAGQEQAREFGLEQSQRQGVMAEIEAMLGQQFGRDAFEYEKRARDEDRADAKDAADRQNRAQSAGALGSLAAALIKSSVHSKDIIGFADLNYAAQIIGNIPIHAWTYKKGLAPIGDHGGLHVGPMAEDFQSMTGLGSSRAIDAVDYLGILTAALQAALIRIDQLEGVVFRGDEFVISEHKPERVH